MIDVVQNRSQDMRHGIYKPRFSSELRAFHSFKSPLACRTKIIPRRMHPTNYLDHLIFIQLVNADDSRTPSKRSRCARFRVTPERPASKLLCVLQFARISTYQPFRRVMITRTYKGAVAKTRVWQCPKRNIRRRIRRYATRDQIPLSLFGRYYYERHIFVNIYWELWKRGLIKNGHITNKKVIFYQHNCI